MQNFNRLLVKTFNLKQDETLIFSLLFFHSFFLGLFIAFYFVPANAVFIQHFGSQQLPLAYMASGLVGYLSTYLYSSLQKKVNSKALFMGSLIFMLIITIIARISLNFFDEKWLSFFVFIWAWPFISLVGIEAGGLSLRYLNLIQVKRLFGLFNMGGVLASIIGYLTIPLLAHFIGHSYNFLIIGITGVIASIVILFMIYKRFPDKAAHEGVTKKTKTNTNIFSLIKEKYFLLIFLSATFSMVAIYIIDFGFLSSIKVQKELFRDPQSVSKFMALVFGGLKVGELVISYFSSRLLSKYGVKLGLTILPFVLSIIIAGASAVGLLLGVTSIIFLILMTVNKSLERILRRGLDDPAFNILYQPLPDQDKIQIQSKVGVVQQFSIGLAGFFLFVTNFILVSDNGFQLQYFPLLFLPFLVTWVFISRNLYSSYKGKIRQILVDISKDKKIETTKYLYGSEVLTKKLKKNNEQVVSMSVTILSETNPKLLEPYAAMLLESNDSTVQKAVLRNIDPTWRQRFLDNVTKLIENTNSAEIKHLSEKARNCLDYSKTKTLKQQDINQFIVSEQATDRLEVVKYLYKNILPGDESFVLKLLEDKDKIIKTAAIILAAKRKTPLLVKKLIEFLTSSEYFRISSNVLLEIGDRVLPDLDIFFNEKTPSTVLLRIIEIYARIGSSNAKSYLISHLDYPNRDVQLNVMWALYFCRFQADSKDMIIIRRKFEEIVENILWLYATMNDIQEEKNTLKLFMALDRERENYFELLFQVLSFMYEPRIINLIRKNIIGKNTIFALEIIDNFISQDIKQYIVPLFDDISVNQKLKKLNSIFPQGKMLFQERLKSIITREFNKIDNWSITKAIELLGKLHKSTKTSKGSSASALFDYHDIEVWSTTNVSEILERIRKSEMPDEVFLCLFHTDELVYQTAARIIYEENPVKCNDYLINMSTEKHQLMDVISSDGQLIPEKIALLKRHPLFFKVHEKLLVKLARIARFKDLKKNHKVFLQLENQIDDIIIILKGSLYYLEQDEEITFHKNDIIIKGLNINQSIEYLEVKTDIQIAFVNRFEYFNLLLSETDIIHHIFNEIQAEVEPESEIEK